MVERHQVMIDGTLGASGQERWCVGIHYSADATTRMDTPAQVQAWASGIAAYLQGATIPGLKNLLSSSGRITAVRTYYYPPTGPAIAAGQIVLTTPISGSGTAARPPQCTHVFTLSTGLAGRRHRGRIYWPSLAGSFDGATLKGVPPGTAVTEVADMLRSIGNAGTGSADPDPVVYSAAGDIVTEVTAVRVGDVIDTQRRRRDKLVETYSSATVPA